MFNISIKPTRFNEERRAKRKVKRLRRIGQVTPEMLYNFSETVVNDDDPEFKEFFVGEVTPEMLYNFSETIVNDDDPEFKEYFA